MLLVKFEGLDDYCEECLFKFEKNVKHLEAFDQRGRETIASMIGLVQQIEQVNRAVSAIALEYPSLLELEPKLVKLQANQKVVYEALVAGLNKRASLGLKETKLAYLVCRHIGLLWREFEGDIDSKLRVIRDSLPRIAFKEPTANALEESLCLMLDVWTYSN